MPKIIENVRELILGEAHRQIEENGYDAVTIRSIAKGCNIGLGTFYNYFKSKDVLIATYLLEDWQERITRLREESVRESDPMAVLKSINAELNGFMQSNGSIFSASDAKKAFNSVVGNYHGMLIEQISQPLFSVCERNGYENPEFLAAFAAEAILTWTVAKKSFEEIASVMSKLFIKN